MTSLDSQVRVAIIGGGPAGLMAAETISAKGVAVDVYDAMPSVGRKFLQAGVGGLNLTYSEPLAPFISRYAERRQEVAKWLQALSPDALLEWTHGLGIDTFIGTSGRVFPTQMKAAPLLRAWLQRLRSQNVQFHVRHRWQGWGTTGTLIFETPQGTSPVQPTATILACGGGSWPRLGSDGAWVPWVRDRGVDVAPLRPANCGFDVGVMNARRKVIASPTGEATSLSGWSDHLRVRFAGAPLKQVALTLTLQGATVFSRLGEFVLTESGIEGSLIYAAAAPIRDAIDRDGAATVHINLLPHRDFDWVLREVSHPRGKRSLATHLESRLGLKGVKRALLFEVLSADELGHAQTLARTILALPIPLVRPRPIAEVISSAGGVALEALNPQLMCREMPGVFCAGEMLDWEAPTGGYLLTACMASGRVAGEGVLDWLRLGR
jgi:uncharacterized flavoprotein (TIGR03862 family)